MYGDRYMTFKRFKTVRFKNGIATLDQYVRTIQRCVRGYRSAGMLTC